MIPFDISLSLFDKSNIDVAVLNLSEIETPAGE